ncbi:MAG: hypothetical protein CL896_04635 [Dehalococcoidia bacterium]|nr:hypothetical protein [Dehalococcoidia bacterium]|tara:strand:+ start:1824 stop:2528 length:705 start_codon:yes stop_codon:yes gene_type:complete
MLIIGMFFGNPQNAYAHIPYLASDKHNSPESALEIEDITISSVVYQTIHDNSPESWIKFDGIKGETLYFQMGVPKLSRLQNYRPDVVLFTYSDIEHRKYTDTIQKDKGLRYSSYNIKNPEIFHEPFTNTTSWVLFEKNLVLPETGTYFLTSFSEQSQTGKLWIAIGKEESFGISDLGKLPASISQIRSFYEIGSINSVLSYTNVIYVVVVLIAASFVTGLILLWLKILKWIRNN